MWYVCVYICMCVSSHYAIEQKILQKKKQYYEVISHSYYFSCADVKKSSVEA